VSKFLGIFLLLIFITSCSLDNKTGLWTKKQKIKEEKKIIIKELFEEEKALEKEFNPNLKIRYLKKKLILRTKITKNIIKITSNNVNNLFFLT